MKHSIYFGSINKAEYLVIVSTWNIIGWRVKIPPIKKEFFRDAVAVIFQMKLQIRDLCQIQRI
jgi:hypothetical protein